MDCVGAMYVENGVTADFVDDLCLVVIIVGTIPDGSERV